MLKERGSSIIPAEMQRTFPFYHPCFTTVVFFSAATNRPSTFAEEWEFAPVACSIIHKQLPEKLKRVNKEEERKHMTENK